MKMKYILPAAVIAALAITACTKKEAAAPQAMNTEQASTVQTPEAAAVDSATTTPSSTAQPAAATTQASDIPSLSTDQISYAIGYEVASNITTRLEFINKQIADLTTKAAPTPEEKKSLDRLNLKAKQTQDLNNLKQQFAAIKNQASDMFNLNLDETEMQKGFEDAKQGAVSKVDMTTYGKTMETLDKEYQAAAQLGQQSAAHILKTTPSLALIEVNQESFDKGYSAKEPRLTSASAEYLKSLANIAMKNAGTEDAKNYSYVLGTLLKQQEAALNTRAFVAGYNQELTQFKAAQENLKKGEEFLLENAKKEGVVKLESGLQYQIIKEGTGSKPQATDTVKVNYTGKLLDGTVFDSTDGKQPAEFAINQVIPGWTQALELMKVGSTYEFWIPAELAYGNQGAEGRIPPGSTLNFKVELVSIDNTEPAKPTVQ